MTERHWQGEVWLARDHALFAGVNGDTREHAHYAHQLLLAETPLRVRVAGQVLEARRLLVPSLQAHRVDASQPLLALYAEPLAFDSDDLRQLLEDAPGEPEALLGRLARLPRRRLDRRVEKALATLDEQLAARVEAERLARSASLSLSQLERLFAVQVGLSVRRLVLWRRLYLAFALALQGRSLTEAAHHAGFADAAHLSRSVRSLLGIRAGLSLPHLRLAG
ncbi:helix-turn-helix domain-containing protein [Pseudomonas aeruginosa]|uniref:helix-turn-helix transcriptional regulator n=1 Tax=Pseudomonas aeruginosa TaxID=287 RepID=UPI0018C804CF|nr:helix-turn-helix domain-containing protein [Pseudomonas aeruginosa]EKV0396298.1 helix-turn-helix domain-containing protein [Pseudomonas aeruginosa]EKV3011546.1 helix-turn-helix domain-containing protein [Pseudomonas aeruginosa]EKV3024696.1 helix-turn-helix domain-containing protein [Pseudomonas aeruginosa]EKV3025630.1 helix-turn-helix domain-containing protein [Pseudomonas aeruginosa]EKW6549772.1 helix-turn-helix domain-containing protein [Pseudomonas aeruginosa]